MDIERGVKEHKCQDQVNENCQTANESFLGNGCPRWVTIPHKESEGLTATPDPVKM